MDLTTAETRARIACRIYLKLFDAGDGFDGRDMGALIVSNEMDPQRGRGVPDHALVRDVLNSLERHKAVFRCDGSQPLRYALDDSIRNRMADRFAVSRRTPGTHTFATRIREELGWIDDGSYGVPQGTFTALEKLMRGVNQDTDPL